MVKRAFGELELAILTILKSGQKMTVKQVQSKLGAEKNKYTTIMTVMARLAEKKYLAREKKGLQYVYWTLPTKTPSFVDDFKKKLLGFKTFEMISHLIKSSDDLSPEELEEIEKMITNARKKNE